MKLKKRKPSAEEIFEIIVITVAIILAFIAGLVTQQEEYEGGYRTYTIQANDTVYSIAKELNTNEDLNKVIYEIRKDNNITECGNLQIGQELIIREVWN